LKNDFGEIKFSYVSTNQTAFSSILSIANNSAYIDSVNYVDYNVSANITLNGIGNRGFMTPSILKDGVACGSSCYNFTSLTADTVIFNVSSWTNYSIGEEEPDLISPNLTIISPENRTYNTRNILINITNSSDAVNVWWYNGTANITYTGPTYFNFSEGSNTFYAYANDTVGNLNSSSVTFSVDTTPPALATSDGAMFREYLNHTAWDGVDFPVIAGLNQSNFSTGYGAGFSSPAVANGYVYIGSNKRIYQSNASNISQIITYYTLPSADTNDYFTSFSPAIANGYLYSGTAYGYVYQLNASNVSQNITRSQRISFSGITLSPSIYDGYLYIGGSDGPANLCKLNASDVSQEGICQLFPSHTEGQIYTRSSPAIANGYVYTGTDDGYIYHLNASTLDEIANFSSNDYYRFQSSPAVFNGFVYIGSENGYVYQLNASNVSQQIANFSSISSINAGGFDSSPAVANGYVYIGSNDNTTYQLNASNLQEIASFKTGAPVKSSPAVANGYVYIGSEDGYVYQLNASNISQKIANFLTGDYVDSSPAVANGYVYVGSDNGYVYQLNDMGLSTTPTGQINLDLVTPSDLNGMNITQNSWFNVTVNVSCSVVDCGEINVSLDPISGCNPDAEECTSACDGIFLEPYDSFYYSSGWDGDTCYDDDYQYVVDDYICDNWEVSGSNGDCAYNDYEGCAVPSYERKGSAVTADDCYGCDPETCADIFNFDDSFFTGGNSGTKSANGLVNTTIGATPFYTNESNPRTINLNASQSQIVTFWVNATGDADNYTFFAYANKTSDETISNITGSWNVTIVGLDTTSPGINFTNPVPENNVNITDTSAEINISITNAADLNEFKFNWNGTNYTLYNDSLVLMMNFDDYTRLNDTSKYGNNGTNNGATWNSSGKYGGAYEFDGSNDYVDCGDRVSLNITTLTMCAWVNSKTGSLADMQGILAKRSGSVFAYGINFQTGAFQVYTTGASGISAFSYNLPANQWVFICGIISANPTALYVNGILNGTSGDGGGAAIIATPLTIGRSDSLAGEYFNGTIDEVRIYNRSLSAGEIKQLYYSNLNKYAYDKWAFYTNESNLTTGTYTYSASAKDNSGNENQTEIRTLNVQESNTTPPEVYFTDVPAYPDDYVNISGRLMTFVYGVSEITGYVNDTDLANWTLDLYWNDLFNRTLSYNTTPVNGTLYFWNTTGDCTGECENYSLVLNATNNRGNSNVSRIVDITIDNIPPNVSFVNSTVNNNDWTLRANIFDNYLDDADSFISDENGNGSYDCGGQCENQSACRTYKWWIVYNQSSQNNELLGLMNEQLCDSDGCHLNTEIINTTNSKFVAQSYTFNFSSADWIIENVTNITLYSIGDAQNENITYIHANGNYSFAFDANDYAQNYILRAWDLSIDNEVPSIIVYSPNSTTYNNSQVLINFSAADSIGVSSLWYFNGSDNIDYFSENIITLDDGSYNFIFYSNDTSNNINSTSIGFSVNTGVLTISVISPLNQTYTNATILVNLSYSANADNAWFFNGTDNESYTSPVYRTFSEGTNIFRAYANDSSGNLSTATLTFFVDTILPYFTTIPSAININYTQGFGVTFVAADAGVGFSAYAINWTTLFTINQSGYLKNSTVLPVGTYNINVTINDTVNNLNSTIYQITVNKKSDYALGISGTTPITYGTTTDVAGSNCPTELTCSLNPPNATYGAGTVTFNYSTPGNANYSASSITKDIVIDKAAPTLIKLLNGIDTNLTVTYPQEVNASGSTNAGTLIIYMNDTPITNGQNYSLAAGYYKFDFNVTGNENYTNISRTLYATVNKASQTANLSINETSPIIYGKYINVSCNGELFRNNVNVTNQIGQSVLLGAGSYNYSCQIYSDENYTYADSNSTFIVNKATGSVFVYANNSHSGLAVTANTSIWLNATLQNGVGNILLYNNGSLINDGTSPIGNLTNWTNTGLYNVTVIYAGNENYTFTSDMLWINVYGSETQIINNETITLNETVTNAVLPANSSLPVITLGTNSTNVSVSVDLVNLLSSAGNVTLGDNTLILERIGDENYSSQISANVTISGCSGWDGKIYIPLVNTSSSLFSAPSGTVDIIVSVGSNTCSFNFSSPVEIVIGGMAGKRAAWSEGSGSLIDIPTQCDSLTNPTNINTNSPRECYKDSGNDLVIWTYHFTNFAAYTPATTPPGGGSGGGGGGCKTTWNCTQWNSCINGSQARNCSKIKPACSVNTTKPSETQSCGVTPAIPSEGEKNQTETKPDEGETMADTTKYLMTKKIIVAVIIIILVIIIYIVYNRKRAQVYKHHHEHKR